ncbi:hypothetical protein [Variovorax terrae]|uniref:Uncharacterized protein n=1 Tax=Variovorax terrae TaxID=2923278 RepID=A0A9X2AL55_9BURK|nr:hypothetical protein [Variovorax terrae]MCJ0762333.1 hypothetical protein [Variovorax terrae]
MLYVKTEAGRAELSSREHGLTPHQRQVLILCDGERTFEQLVQMMPPTTLAAALERLCNLGLLTSHVPVVLRPVQPKREVAGGDPSDRYRATVRLATEIASGLGFTARLKAQLQIEKAQGFADLSHVVASLCSALEDKGNPPQLTAKLHSLRQMAASA